MTNKVPRIDKEYFQDYVDEVCRVVLSSSSTDAKPFTFQKASMIIDCDVAEVETMLKEPAAKLSPKHYQWVNIDESWDKFFRESEDGQDSELFRNELIYHAAQVHDGLLVLNITNEHVFSALEHLEQLAKQEHSLQIWEEDERFFNMDELKDEVTRMKYNGDSKEEIDKYIDSQKAEVKAKHLVPSPLKFKGYVIFLFPNHTVPRFLDLCRENNREFRALYEYTNRCYY